MLLLKTTFHLRNDLQWDDVYNKCIFPWINGSENKTTRQKNYAGLLRVLPRNLNFSEKKENTFSFGGDSLSYSTFSFKKEDYLGFDFIYSNLNRKWNVRIVLKRNAKYVYCCVSVSCEVMQKNGIPDISKPRIIDYLLNYQDGTGDNGIDIKNDAHFISNVDSQSAINILNGKGKNKLPIVYLSCHERHALRPKDVAKSLYGIAHVYAERDKYLSERIALDVKTRFPRGGEIAICYPTHAPLIINRKDDATWDKKPEILTQDIFRKILRQNIATKAEFSWDDYQAAYTAYLREIAEKERQSIAISKATNEELQAKLQETDLRYRKQLDDIEKERNALKQEQDAFVAAFDDENKELKSNIERLQKEVKELKQQLLDEKNAREAAESNIKALKLKTGPSFALNVPSEPEKYDDEYVNHIICALKMALPKGKGKNASNKQRNLDVWQAILDANPDAVKRYDQYCSEKDELVALAKREELKTPKGQRLLKKFNLVFSKKQNNHGDIGYEKDDRYKAAESSSGSDSGSGGENGASAFERALFCSHK